MRQRYHRRRRKFCSAASGRLLESPKINVSRTDTVDINELLALKSLVLANETRTNDVRELAKTQDEGESSLERVASDGVAMYHPSLARSFIGLPSRDTPASEFQHSIQVDDHSTCPVSSESTRNTDYHVNLSVLWTKVDCFEFALQRFNLAKWEHQRIEENIMLGTSNKPSLEIERKEEFLLRRLGEDMTKFGLDQSLVERTLKILQKSGSWDTSRTEVHCITPKTDLMMEVLGLAGMPWAKDQVNNNFVPTSVQVLNISQNDTSTLLVRRWLPDMFGDVLWEHTRQFLGQQGLLRSIESFAPTRSNTTAMRKCPPAKQNEAEAVRAGMQTDFPKFKRKSVLRDSSPVSIPGEQHVHKNAQWTGSGPRGWETSFDHLQPTLREPENIYRKIEHLDPAEWLDSLPNLSPPTDQQQVVEAFPTCLSHPAGNRETKRRRVDLWSGSVEGEDQRNANEHISLGESLMDSDGEKSQVGFSSSEASGLSGHTWASQHPQARHLPECSNEAINRFNQKSCDFETISRAATWGSRRREFNFDRYQQRRQKGIEGRERFFRLEKDKVLQIVDDLLQRWTFIDAPPNAEQEQAAFNKRNIGVITPRQDIHEN